MENVNLLLRFRMADESDCVRSAARIKLDGNGLTVTASNGAVETLDPVQLRSLSIRSVGPLGVSA
jgi:hypothetical protein